MTRHVTSSFIILVFILSAKAQIKKLDKIIPVHTKAVTVDALLQMITNATGYIFSYNSALNKTKQPLKVYTATLSANQWLEELRSQLKIDHTTVGDHIILKALKTLPVLSSHAQKTVQQKNKPMSLTSSKAPTNHAGKKPVNNIAAQFNHRKSSDTGDSIKASPLTSKSLAQESTATTDTLKQLHKTNMSSAALKDTLTPVKKDQKKDNTKATIVSENFSKIEAGIQGFGYSREQKLRNNFTINISAGIGGAFSVSDKIYYNIGIQHYGAYISANPRFYLRVLNNSKNANDGLYTGIELKYVHDIRKVDFQGSMALANVHVGIQKKLSERFLINAHAGPGYGILVVNWTYPYKKIYPALDFKISYLLRRR